MDHTRNYRWWDDDTSGYTNLVARLTEHRNCCPGPAGTEESCIAKRSLLGIRRTMGYSGLEIPQDDSGDVRDEPKPIPVKPEDITTKGLRIVAFPPER